MTQSEVVQVVGGGLAGAEAAWQVAEQGIDVVLWEMRPKMSTPAHVTEKLAELVCSNSLGSDLPDRAGGLLKEELRRLNSLILTCADETKVPAGGALAVGRDEFAVQHSAEKELRGLSNVMLKDIGVSRGEIHSRVREALPCG